MEIKDNRIVGVKYKASPNIGGVITPQYLVQHYDASPNAIGAVSWMVSPTSKVSAHLHIDREGNIIQLVDFNRKAQHAGESTWRGVNGLNSYSIGIEIQNTGSQEYTAKQMDSVIEVSKLLVEHYKLKEVIGHEDIAINRKTDPSGSKHNLFDWVKLSNGVGIATPKMSTTTSVNLRVGYGTEYPILTELAESIEVFEILKIGDWSKVQVACSLQSGYVFNKYIK